MLHLRGVFKSAVDDGAEAFRFEDEIFKSRCMYTNVMTSGKIIKQGCVDDRGSYLEYAFPIRQNTR